MEMFMLSTLYSGKLKYLKYIYVIVIMEFSKYKNSIKNVFQIIDN